MNFNRIEGSTNFTDLPFELLFNIVKSFNRGTYNSAVQVCKIWSEVFSYEGFQCLNLGLEFNDLDILRAIKNDKKIPEFRKNPIFQVYLIAQEAIKATNFLKAERCLPYLRVQQQAFCRTRIINYYNTKKNESTFNYLTERKLKFLNSDKFQNDVKQSPCKRLKFTEDEV